MPRNGSGVASPPPNTSAGPPNTTIASAKQNSVIADIYALLNSPAPFAAGGTNASTKEGARTSLEVDKQVVYSEKSANYTALVTDNNVVFRFTAAATLSLDPAATLGANWHVVVIADGGDVTIDPNASETIDGAATLVVQNGSSTEIYNSGSAFYTDKMAAKADNNAVGSFIDGCILSNNSGNPNTHVDIAAGTVRAGTSVVINGSSITKRLNSTFVAGTGNGGLDTGAVTTNGTYFAYALRKNSDRSFDAVFSTSATIGGVNTASLTGYTIVKQIGVVLTDGSSNIRQFVMNPGDEYTWTTPIPDVVNFLMGATSGLMALTLPNGVKVKAKISAAFTSSITTNQLLISSPDQSVLIAGINNSGGNVGTVQVSNGFSVADLEKWSNTTRQLRYVAAANGNMWVWTIGFTFPCGRN